MKKKGQTHSVYLGSTSTLQNQALNKTLKFILLHWIFDFSPLGKYK